MTRKGSGAKINHLAEDDEKPPAWALRLFGSQSSGVQNPPPPPHPAPRPSRAEREDATAALRSASPNSRKAFNLKFRFAGCWHCGEKGHSRRANAAKGIAGCPKFERLKAQNGGQTPPGYKGAYEKARDAAWEKFQAAKSKPDKKVNHLEDPDATDHEDQEDSHSDIERNEEMCCALRSPGLDFTHPNPFDELAEDDLDEEAIQNFQAFAQMARSGSSTGSSTSKTIHIASLEDLDAKMASEPKLAALPSNTRRLQRRIQKLEAQQVHLEDDEMLALVDTGSNIHAADADVHFPMYANTVRSTPASRRGHTATAAGGQKLQNLGKFVVHGNADGQDLRIPFNHMKVKLPILSVRELMSKGCKMTLTEHGGVIRNKMKNQQINFVVHDDLWYVKLKVKPPPSSEAAVDLASPFGRQGTR